MTDNFDLDPHGHPETHAEEGHGHEAKAEAWPDDQPPADGYEDPSVEETASSSEETGSASHEDVMETSPRKSSPMLPIAAGIGGLLLVGAVLYWQFGRSSSAPMAVVQAPPPLQMAQPASPPPLQIAAAPEASPPNALAPSMPMPANDVAPKTAMTPSADSSSVAMPSGTAPTPVVSTPAPVSAVAAAPEPTAPPTSFPAPSIAPPPTAAMTGDSMDNRVNNLSTRIDEMKKQLDQISTASPSSSTTGTEDRLTRIEQQLKQIEHSSSGAAVMADTASSNEAATLTAPQSKPTHHGVTHKKSHNTVTIYKHSMHTTPAKTGWVLRAATPGEAWIAKSEGSTDLRRVRVGDTLAGIGRVHAIRQVGDNWIVEGTAGSIR